MNWGEKAQSAVQLQSLEGNTARHPAVNRFPYDATALVFPVFIVFISSHFNVISMFPVWMISTLQLWDRRRSIYPKAEKVEKVETSRSGPRCSGNAPRLATCYENIRVKHELRSETWCLPVFHTWHSQTRSSRLSQMKHDEIWYWKIRTDGKTHVLLWKV